MWRKGFLAVATLLLIASIVEAGLVSDVVVRFVPPSQIVNFDDVFTVDVVADINTPVVGWGLDVDLSVPTIASTFAAPSVAFPPWIAAAAADGDGLAGLADPFAPTNGSVSGIGILLATLTFHADAQGTTDLLMSTTPGDLSEGFPLDPTGFATVTFEPGQVVVVPEPATLLPLLAVLSCGVGWPRGRRAKPRRQGSSALRAEKRKREIGTVSRG